MPLCPLRVSPVLKKKSICPQRVVLPIKSVTTTCCRLKGCFTPPLKFELVKSMSPQETEQKGNPGIVILQQSWVNDVWTSEGRRALLCISVEYGSHAEISFCTLRDLMICSSLRCEGSLDAGHRVWLIRGLENRLLWQCLIEYLTQLADQWSNFCNWLLNRTIISLKGQNYTID